MYEVSWNDYLIDSYDRTLICVHQSNHHLKASFHDR